MAHHNNSFRYRSQRFWVEGTQDYETRDGRITELLALYTKCPDCGVGFRMMATRTAIRTRNLRRRCDACKRQGVPVEYCLPPKTGKKAPQGAVKGNPRPKASDTPKAAPRAELDRVVAPTAPGLSTPRWLTRPMLRRPMEPKIGRSALVDAVEQGVALGMLVQPSDCCGEAEGDA